MAGQLSQSTDQDLDKLRRLSAADHGLAVVVTQRADGGPLCSVVNAGLYRHPVTGAPVVAFVSRGDAARLDHLRRRPRATLVFRAEWEWISVEGQATLAGPQDPIPEMSISLPQLLREIFRAAGGTHDDWDEYDRVMAREGRTAVMVGLDRVYGNRST